MGERKNRSKKLFLFLVSENKTFPNKHRPMTYTMSHYAPQPKEDTATYARLSQQRPEAVSDLRKVSAHPGYFHPGDRQQQQQHQSQVMKRDFHSSAWAAASARSMEADRGTLAVIPPPHGGSKAHFGLPHHEDPRNDPRYMMPHRSQPLKLSSETPPPSHVPAQTNASQGDVPLDLGSSSKRKSDIADAVPKKNSKLDVTNSVLFKVSEPSVLVTSEPSIITTVMNTALSGGPSNGPKPETETPPLDFTSQPSGYVHKLKKAWIKAYSSNNEEVKSEPPASSVPSVLSNFARGTPSPALSTKSSSASSMKNAKVGSTSSKPGTPQPSFNGNLAATSSPRRAGASRVSGKGTEDEEVSSDSSSPATEVVKLAQCRRGTAIADRLISSKPGRRTRSSRNLKMTEMTIESSDNSDCESGKDKDANETSPTGRRRRRPGNKATEKKRRKASPDDQDANPFQRPSVTQLKRTGESFLQDKSCSEEAPGLAKCLECRWTQSQRNKKMPNIFCRFYAFRRLRYAKNGRVAMAGFCDPYRDFSKKDAALWHSPAEMTSMTESQAKYILDNIRLDFNLIVKQERRSVQLHCGEGTLRLYEDNTLIFLGSFWSDQKTKAI